VLASQIAITALFALSLDLILGFCGIVSLGHAAYFGVGAYTAGLLSKWGFGEPLSGLVLAALAAGIFGYLTSFIIARFRHLALIMLTLGLALLLQEIANSASWLTGGSDGLQGIHTWPIFAASASIFTATRPTLFARALVCRFFCAAVDPLPLGCATRHPRTRPACRLSARRRGHIQHLYDRRHRRRALLAQTTETVSARSSVSTSADVLVMLILGGTGRPAAGSSAPPLRDRARSILRAQSAILVFLDRAHSHRGGHAAAERYPRRPGIAHAAREGKTVSEIALSARGLYKSFGSLVVASDIELTLPAGARYALIGPNGAGKTTLINLMTGMLRPDAGRIALYGADITALPPEQRVKRGLVRTFQINALFPHLTAIESVTLAVCEGTRAVRTWWRKVSAYRHEIDEAYDILAALLTAVCHRPTRELAYGQQRLLEIALAMATRPKVLLLDEPAAGVPREDSAELFNAIAGLSREITVLFIEHDMELVFRFASRVIVLVGGRVLVEGTPHEIASDPQVRAVYLGRAMGKIAHG
jgi:ABC-type branched-subunit amino acid transport system ATPase component/branched-subunit amino acid ABC-type transport system permease component